ncbi:TolB family protein [Desulfosarcina ovata]|uniref:TolB family protein n=1 Tax=Desulfosarcina ovata TaxID=83564 RepID=UPI0012D32C86|nr:PD40 domain-containing protein [Desulfosarcina ovata]
MLKHSLIIICISVLAFAASNLFADMAFVANVDGNWELFRATDDGRNPIRITTTVHDERDPCWFPDRNKIAYSASDGGIYVANLDSGKTNLILQHDPKRPQITPSVSPDSKKIAFSQFRLPDEKDDTDLMIHYLDSERTSRLLDQPAIQIWPSWSPDGTRIAYASVHCSAECGRIIQELWVAESRGSWSRQLLLTHGFCQQPDWSPDGRRIAFSSDHGGNYDIWIVDLDDWKLQQLTVDKALDVKPAWSPDGKEIAFVSTRSGLMEIWVKNLGRGNLQKLSPFGDRKVECKDVAW